MLEREIKHRTELLLRNVFKLNNEIKPFDRATSRDSGTSSIGLHGRKINS